MQYWRQHALVLVLVLGLVHVYINSDAYLFLHDSFSRS